MKSNEFDQTDRIIVDELVRDGRISYVELAEKVGISRVAVKDRINSLINKGVIENFTAVINSERFGQNISAFFEVDVEPMNLQAVAQNLADNPSVASIYQMTGPSTLHMHVLVEDFKMLEAFINDELYSVEGITRVDSSIILKRFKSRKGYKL
ncbi:Lrp/AsnC family transcriptional regulator [Halobacillus kuroshimensis]|uniref:Winged helix-turn-helix transcriptional regulator n=2 Tax=Halobacillus TaxID=45667 RepID=A0A845DT47_9BACI|nr:MULTISPECIES: Lrp/AsnC family transcriptional regulator [Halobacillus]MBN8235163.1 Lrp/AsnC family transcriptional regulator [Halobacillus kuroshimensis]MYL20773.1 winged helix-turn-helix transcriptional regulator [Halobacillus litoralis]MYL30815.1 winged helix-turn-helix transcriptional regulator [Halobacillus halophilus]MYL36379.1 winged helix-turn-helix transcriptional regulator [Halobacillus litoralis]